MAAQHAAPASTRTPGALEAARTARISSRAGRYTRDVRATIGITPCLDDRGRWRAGRDYVYADLAYARAIEAAGGVPVLLPPQKEPGAALERVDAVLLPGGDDFLPAAAYPEKVAFDPTPPAQLDFDGQLLEGAARRDQPVLGICYGMQRLALQRGGSLHYHLPFDLPEAGPHELAGEGEGHGIRFEAGARLAVLLGTHPVERVNSIHHQAVREPGGGLRVAARAPDGVIEAIEDDNASFCVGVQWHPERLADDGSRALFRAFVAAAEAYASQR